MLNGIDSPFGLVLARGNDVNEGGFAGSILAHEIGHQCGLYDIYKAMTNTPLVVSCLPSYNRLPYDWGGGYYSNELTQADLVQRLLLYGVGSASDPNPGIDIPSGQVYGLCYTNAPVTGNQIWYLDLGKVGQSDISDQVPNHY